MCRVACLHVDGNRGDVDEMGLSNKLVWAKSLGPLQHDFIHKGARESMSILEVFIVTGGSVWVYGVTNVQPCHPG